MSGAGIGDEDTSSEILMRLDELQARVTQLERSRDPGASRVMQHCKGALVNSARLKWVPPDYYSRPMEARAEILGCYVEQMCKTLVMENVAWEPSELVNGSENSRFYAVVVQYAAKLNVDKLARCIRGLTKDNPLPPGKFRFRLASAEDNCILTGYSHNAVSPFGLATDLPVVLSEAVVSLRPRFMWMGAGHVNCKLGCTVYEFVRALDPIVGNVSDPRTGYGDDGDL